MILDDTIAAVSSAVGPAARMIVRISGPRAGEIVLTLAPQANFEQNSARRHRLTLGRMTFPAWAYWFVGPRSYTGEDIAELHVPGNPLLCKLLLEEIVRQGARHAEPGEFTARAYFNGRIDLSQAEGVAATIAATTARHLSAARRLLNGELSQRLAPVMQALGQMLALVEVGIDFSEEDVAFLSIDQVKNRIDQVRSSLAEIVVGSVRFERLAHEPAAVLAGRPNAGKSTLINALAGEHRAIVSPVAGTTRDALSARVKLRRGYVQILDIAGLEDARPDNTVAADSLASQAMVQVESRMQGVAREQLETADLIVLVRDGSDKRAMVALPRPADLTVYTKLDLWGQQGQPTDGVAVSAVTGKRMSDLIDALDVAAFGGEGPQSGLALNSRHHRAIQDALAALARAEQNVNASAAELVAADVREALDSLGQICGAITPDEILGKNLLRVLYWQMIDDQPCGCRTDQRSMSERLRGLIQIFQFISMVKLSCFLGHAMPQSFREAS